MEDWVVMYRAVIKRRGPVISPGYYERAPGYFHRKTEETRTKRNP